MKSTDAKQILDKTDALDILDRTIDFIRNCDNKASIFLGVLGAILAIVLTTDGLGNLVSIIQTAFDQRTFCSILYLLILSGSIVATIFGLGCVLKVLGVQLDFSSEPGLDRDSKIFFKHISRNSYLCYKQKLLTSTEDNLINDITSQIYINSCICSDKYRYYKRGLSWSLWGIFSFIVLWIIGFFVF